MRRGDERQSPRCPAPNRGTGRRACPFFIGTYRTRGHELPCHTWLSCRHRVEVPLRGIEGLVSGCVLGIPAPFRLAVDDVAAPFDSVGDDARIDAIARKCAGMFDDMVLHLAS